MVNLRDRTHRLSISCRVCASAITILLSHNIAVAGGVESRDWRAIKDLYLQVHSKADYEWIVTPSHVDLGHCGSGFAIGPNDQVLAEELGFTGEDAAKITLLAHELAFAEAALGKSPYPVRLWRRIVDNIEISRREWEGESVFEYAIPDPNTQTVEVIGSLVYELDRLINREVEEAGLSPLPILSSSDECGGGNVPVYIKTEPDGARVWYSSDFGRMRCELRGIASDDVVACGSWFEITGEFPKLAGIVHLQAKWPNGDLSISRREVVPEATFVLRR